MKQKDIKEKEATEMKQKRKEEKEQRRVDKEQEQSRKRKEQEEKKGKGKKFHRQSSSEDEDPDVGNKDRSHFQSSSRTRSIRVPDRYWDRSGVESDESDTVCTACNAREPPIADTMVFWVDCGSVGSELIHNVVWAATLRPTSSFAFHVLRNNSEL